MELRAERGRAVLVGAPELFEPPTALAGALDEWAEVAAAVCGDGPIDPETAELVSARGRQLAARLAAAAGTPVGYADPIRGVVERISAAAHTPAVSTPAAGAASTTGPVSAPEPATAAGSAHTAGVTSATGPVLATGPATDSRPAVPSEAEPVSVARPAQAPDRAAGSAGPHGEAPDEPTPWATGLTVSAITATVVVIAVVALVRGLAELSWWLGALALAVVTAGLAPSVWLARNTPLWRWVSYGVAGGLALSWVAVPLSTLGP